MYSHEWKIIDIILYMALLTMAQFQASRSTLLPGNFICIAYHRYPNNIKRIIIQSY